MKIYNLNEITYSKIQYDKKPPKFIFYIILIVVIVITIFFAWANKSVKTYVVKGQGVVTTENKANVMASVSGQIEEVFIEEGKEVNEGDVLLTIKATDANLQLEAVKPQIDYINNRIELLTRAEKDVSLFKNDFNKRDPVESEFYNRLVNLYTKESEYKVNESDMKSQGATDEQIASYKKTKKIQQDEAHYDGLLQFTSEKQQLILEREKLIAQKNSLEKDVDSFKIVAPKNGKIHLSSPLNKGMVIQAGNTIGSIANKNDELIVEAMILSKDRPMIHVNEEASLAVAGLNQAEYGTIKGKIVSIDEDASIDNQNGNVYFKVKLEPDKNYLVDKKGGKVNLTLGMITESRVKYEKVTYMKYFLEQIGISFN